jgi:hypothetical protein
VVPSPVICVYACVWCCVFERRTLTSCLFCTAALRRHDRVQSDAAWVAGPGLSALRQRQHRCARCCQQLLRGDVCAQACATAMHSARCRRRTATATRRLASHCRHVAGARVAVRAEISLCARKAWRVSLRTGASHWRQRCVHDVFVRAYACDVIALCRRLRQHSATCAWSTRRAACAHRSHATPR